MINHLKMDIIVGVLLSLCLSSVVSSDNQIIEPENNENLPRYIVFPGLDADSEEIGEWNYGFASPFNVFFGPKPYVLGWVGEAPFGPIDEEGELEEGEEVEGEGEYEEGEEAEEGEIDEGNPEYDYENK